MSRLFYHVAQDNAGNLLFDVSGTMRLAGSGTLATIYGDEALTVILPNPMTNHASFGSFKCFLGAGDYDFYLAKSGYTFETLTGVQGYGTMAQQDASNVNITGGVAGLNTLEIVNYVGIAQVPGTDRLSMVYDRGTGSGLAIRPSADSGAGLAAVFKNAAGTFVGGISTDGTTTTYATTSDVRLKEAIEPLTGALDVVRALNPVAFRWRSDDSPGRGFLAHEVQAVVGGVITGTRDAVDADGNIQPQMIDYSKLVPYLIGAVKELTQQVEALTAQLAAVGV